MTAPFILTGKVALLTGGTLGIGRAIVQRFLEAGAKVAFCSPVAEDYEAVERELDTCFPDHVAGFFGDLEDVTSLRALVEQTIARWGRIDILVCNAAVMGGHGPPLELNAEFFERLLRVNIVNNFELVRMVIPQMLDIGTGNIVLITTIGAYGAYPSALGYSVAKTAVASMAKNLAAEFAASGLRINCVSPGLIGSHATMQAWPDPDALAAYASDIVPMQRVGETSEIADACLFLTSPAGNYITGATLPVDGGRLGLGDLHREHLRKRSNGT